MRPLFSILSTLYIAGIFILPKLISSSLLSKVWNPYSLLHIPMYGVLMMLLTLTFEPRIFSQRRGSSGVSFVFLSGGFATAVRIPDEFHQVFIPYRDAPIGDVMLDIAGIALAGILISFNQQRRRE
jgi:VanZ family protein